jgi:hypothetical protein
MTEDWIRVMEHGHEHRLARTAGSVPDPEHFFSGL